MRRKAWLLLALCMVIGGGAAAQDWVVIEEYPRVDGYLGDRAPEPSRFDNREIYDQGTYKFYSVFPVVMDENRSLTVDVYSCDFQPIVFVQDMLYWEVARGTILTAERKPPCNAKLYKARLEFMPDAGDYEILISSHEIGQGSFTIMWSLWGWQEAGAPPPTPPGGTPPAGSWGVDPQCTCVAGNRRLYRTEWGQCGAEPVSDSDPKWCN